MVLNCVGSIVGEDASSEDRVIFVVVRGEEDGNGFEGHVTLLIWMEVEGEKEQYMGCGEW